MGKIEPLSEGMGGGAATQQYPSLRMHYFGCFVRGGLQKKA